MVIWVPGMIQPSGSEKVLMKSGCQVIEVIEVVEVIEAADVLRTEKSLCTE